MPLTYQSIKLAPNASHTFTFTDTVYAYTVGVASFLFTYGNDDHHVDTLSLSLTANKAGATNNQVAVKVNGVLTDGEGHGMDYANSYVTVVCLAWTGSSTAYTYLSGPFTVGNEQQSNPIYLPGSNPNIAQATMAGFSFSYGSDHHVEGEGAGIGVSINQNQALLNGVANMWDESGNKAQNPTVTGNLLASTDSNPGFFVVPWTAQNSLQNTIPMGRAVTDAVSLITSFNAQFDDDHHLQTVGAGPDVTHVSSSDNTQVITSGVWAFMNDADGNSQDNSKSSCSIVVLGWLPTSSK